MNPPNQDELEKAARIHAEGEAKTAAGLEWAWESFRAGADWQASRSSEREKVLFEALEFIAIPGALQTKDAWEMKRAREALATYRRLGGGG